MGNVSFPRREFLSGVAATAATALLPARSFGLEGHRSTPLAPDLLARIDAFWAGHFGCLAGSLNAARTTVVPHKSIPRYDGVLVFHRGVSCIISVPDSMPVVEQAKLRAASPAEALHPEFLSKTLLVAPCWVSAPFELGFADPAAFRWVPSDARLLGKSDLPAVENLALSCGELACHRFRLLPHWGPVFGLSEDRQLVAASWYVAVHDVLALLAVVVHPDHRGRGLAKKVVSRAMRDAFSKGLIPAWRSPAAAKMAISLGRSLGFQAYASTVYVQLSELVF